MFFPLYEMRQTNKWTLKTTKELMGCANRNLSLSPLVSNLRFLLLFSFLFYFLPTLNWPKQECFLYLLSANKPRIAPSLFFQTDPKNKKPLSFFLKPPCLFFLSLPNSFFPFLRPSSSQPYVLMEPTSNKPNATLLFFFCPFFLSYASFKPT